MPVFRTNKLRWMIGQAANPPPDPASSALWAEPFEVPNGVDRLAPYGFGTHNSNGSALWNKTHMPAAGRDGAGACYVDLLDTIDQANLEWELSIPPIKSDWAGGDWMYFAWRMRLDNDWRWDEGASYPWARMQIKALDTSKSGSRNIVLIEGGAGGGDTAFFENTTGPDYNEAADYNFEAGTFAQAVFGTVVLREFATSGLHTKPLPIHGGRWFDVIVGAKFSSSVGVADGEYHVWLNTANAAETDPRLHGQVTGVVNDIGNANTDMTVKFMGYVNGWATGIGRDQGVLLDDFRVYDTFPTDFCVLTSRDANGDVVNDGLPFVTNNESGGVTEWDAAQTQGGAMQVLMSATEAPYGMHYTRMPLTDAVHQNNFYLEKNFGTAEALAAVDEACVTFFNRLSANYNLSAGWSAGGTHKLFIFNLHNPRVFQVYLYLNADREYCVMVSEWADSGNTFVNDRVYAQNVGTYAAAPLQASLGSYDKITLFAAVNTLGGTPTDNIDADADGVIRLYVNGVKVMDYSTANIRRRTSETFTRAIASSYCTPALPVGSNFTQDQGGWEITSHELIGG